MATVVVGLMTVLVLSALPILALWALLHQCDLFFWLGDRWGDRTARRQRRTMHLVPQGRPIEAIAVDVRRLARRVDDTQRGVSFAKYQALQHAYDRALIEGCRALDIPQRLETLPAGDVRDLERRNIEFLLEEAGLRLKDVA